MVCNRDESMETADLKQRDEAIWQKYCQNVDENNLVAIYRQGMFLGIYEQLVRILRRNTEILPKTIETAIFQACAGNLC